MWLRSVTKSYYRGAAGALLVYDVTSRDSYNALGNWLSDAQNLANPNLVVLLVGNKRDLESERQITFLEASRFAQENGKLHSVCIEVLKTKDDVQFNMCRSCVFGSECFNGRKCGRSISPVRQNNSFQSRNG